MLFQYGWMCGVALNANRNSPKIESNSHLEEVVEREKKKLNCNIPIFSLLSDKVNAAATRYDYEDGSVLYTIVVGGWVATESSVKHEVYHICDGHLIDKADISEPIKTFRYLFWEEPQAILYQAFDLEI